MYCILLNSIFQEASLTQTPFDERIFDPLVLRYQCDIGTADAMRASLSESTKELQSLRSNAEKYHFFLECLQNSFVRPESLSLSGSCIQGEFMHASCQFDSFSLHQYF